MKIRSSKGIALAVALVTILCLLTVAGAILTLGYNFNLIINNMGGTRSVDYYKAQAGVVDAQWRLRTNFGGINTVLDPPSYQLDIDGDATNDVQVDIGPVIDPLTQTRQIISESL